MLLVLLLVAYERVRRSAATRDVVACLFGKLWAEQVLGCSSTQTTAGRCRALAQRYVRVEELRWVRRCTYCGSVPVLIYFFLSWKTRDKKERWKDGHRCTQRTAGGLETKAGTCLRFWGIRSWSCSSLLCFPSPKAKAIYSDTFTLRTRALIAVQPHSQSCAA